jgi:hypothetical protein
MANFKCYASSLNADYTLALQPNGSWAITHTTGTRVWACPACTADEAIEQAEFDGFEFDRIPGRF